MKVPWRTFQLRSSKWLKTGWLITAVLVAVYGGFIRPSRAFRGIAMEKTAALAAIERNRHWLVPLPQSVDNATLAAGILGGTVSRSAPAMSSSSTSFSSSEKAIAKPVLTFFVALCHALQEQENELTATDAYWFGLVDEVWGNSDLVCTRMFEEYADEPESDAQESHSEPNAEQPPVPSAESTVPAPDPALALCA